ncbi:MAG: FGGY family carbohydrate kinase [Gemmatimonadota bacterium]
MTDRRAILTLDVGSSSARARLYDERLRPFEAERPAVVTYGWQMDGGSMVIDPAALFDRVVSVLDQAVESSRALGVAIAAVATTTFWHSLLGLNRAREPLTPLYGWGDGRAAGAAERLRRRLDADDYHRRTGCFLTSTYPAARLAWLEETDPALFASVASWAAFGDYLESRLLGTHRTTFSIASASGLLDVRKLSWDGEVLESLGLSESRLPELLDPQPASGLGSEWSSRWPELRSAVWLPALGDGACANVGSGAIGPARPGLTVGTSAALRVLRRAGGEDDPPASLWDYRLDSRYRIAGGALSNGGNALAFLLDTFPQLSREEISVALAEKLPDSHGLTVLPALVAERGADSAGAHAAVLSGLSLSSRPVQIAQTWLEAIARRLADPFAALEREFGPAEEVRASGGALQAVPGWVRTFADVFERPVRLTADPEATSRGAAVVAARTLGWIDSIEDAAPPVAGGFEPDADRHRTHRRAAAREHELSRALRQISSAE